MHHFSLLLDSSGECLCFLVLRPQIQRLVLSNTFQGLHLSPLRSALLQRVPRRVQSSVETSEVKDVDHLVSSAPYGGVRLARKHDVLKFNVLKVGKKMTKWEDFAIFLRGQILISLHLGHTCPNVNMLLWDFPSLDLPEMIKWLHAFNFFGACRRRLFLSGIFQ